MKKILILGGYGNFGKRIALNLVKAGIPIILAGRNLSAAKDLCKSILRQLPNAQVDIACFDIDIELMQQLQRLSPAVVINTCGPFQNKQYTVAQECIKQGVHYIDLADGREFVNGIAQLDRQAKQANSAVVSGASTVPGLSSSVLEVYKSQFQSIESLIYGVSPGQKADRGIATTEAILSYVGKPLKPCRPNQKKQYGWQDIYLQPYPIIGKRWMASCDIPDLDLFPKQYGIKKIRFLQAWRAVYCI